MNTAEFTLRLICLQGDVHKRLEAITEFLTLYEATEKKPLPPIMNAELQLKQSQIQQQMGSRTDGWIQSS